VSRRFVEWMQGGPPDIGGTTRTTLSGIASGTPWFEGALAEYRRNPNGAANGSLMRNGVVPGMAGSLEDALRITLSHGVMTHYAPLPQICCAAQTYLIWRLMEGLHPFAGDWPCEFRACFEEGLDHADDLVREWRENVAKDMTAAWATFEEADWDADTFDPFSISYSRRAGYCLLTLQIAVWAVQWSLRKASLPTPGGFPTEVFERQGPWVLGWVAMIGHDSDTYGAAAGPLIAAAHRELPKGFTEELWVLET
jgi:ADP-ribosylglycohydrolase